MAGAGIWLVGKW